MSARKRLPSGIQTFAKIREDNCYYAKAFYSHFEFKVVELAPEGQALQQIKDRGYAQKYLACRKPIHLIGIEFSREQRNVVGVEVKTVQLQCWQCWRLPQCTG